MKIEIDLNLEEIEFLIELVQSQYEVDNSNISFISNISGSLEIPKEILFGNNVYVKDSNNCENVIRKLKDMKSKLEFKSKVNESDKIRNMLDEFIESNNTCIKINSPKYKDKPGLLRSKMVKILKDKEYSGMIVSQIDKEIYVFKL